MGSFINAQVNPNCNQIRSQQNSIFKFEGEVSRANFTLIKKITTFGVDQEAILWLASNVKDPNQTFYIKQINKFKVYNHKRVDAVLNQMYLLTQSTNPYIIKPYFAFQDYQYLYLVTEAISSVTFQQLLKNHTFSEDQTRYVVFALISILQYVHSKGFALTELSPKNIHFNAQNGQMKLLEIPNTAKIDQYFQSNAVSQVCPYSAPEVLLRDKILAECDYYSLGVIIYEMMTQETAINLPAGKQSYDRGFILKEVIEVQKSQIPEQWQPQSADFLIKLLIKSPSLRLGRYGSYQVKNHPWLKQFDCEEQFKKGIDLREYEIVHNKSNSSSGLKFKQQNGSQQLMKNFFFQSLFQKYFFKFVRVQEDNQIQKKESELSSEQKSSIIFNYSHLKLHQNTL